jgi:hypothetical protein
VDLSPLRRGVGQKMGIEQFFNGVIDLPKSAYFFTQRVTFWSAFFAALSIIFLSIDTAINDIILTISHNLKRKCENIAMGIVGMLYPKYGYA